MHTHLLKIKLLFINKYHFTIFRFLSCSDKWTKDMKSEIDEVITQYVHKMHCTENVDTIITHITLLKSVSKKDQFQMFNTISNYHWIDYIQFKNSKGHKDNSIMYSSHLLWFPDEQDRRNHLPTSPRLRLLQFFLFEEEYKNSIGPLVRQLVQMDMGEEHADYVLPIKRTKKTKHSSGHIV